jgi:hypothetical protein
MYILSGPYMHKRQEGANVKAWYKIRNDMWFKHETRMKVVH